MRRNAVMLATVCALGVGIAVGAEVFSVNTVGVMKIPIQGGGTFNLISVPMHKLPVDFGTVSGATASTLQDSGASWTAGQYAKGVTGAEATGASTFYVELTSGPHEGRHFYIATNDATSLTIDGGLPADVAASLSGVTNAQYKIVPAQRVRDVFGEPGTSPLQAGGSFSTADYVLTWNGATFGSPIWYAGAGYVQGAGFANDIPIDRDAGLFVHRRAAGNTNLTITGEVSGNDQQVVLAQGFNLIGGMDVTDPTLATSNLGPAMKPGAASFSTSDYLIQWAGSTYDTPIWYASAASAWVQGASVVSTTAVVEAGSGYFLRKRDASAVWTRPTPLQ